MKNRRLLGAILACMVIVIGWRLLTFYLYPSPKTPPAEQRQTRTRQDSPVSPPPSEQRKTPDVGEKKIVPPKTTSASFQLQSAEKDPDVLIGSTDKATGFRFQLVPTARGAGLRQIRLADFDESVYDIPPKPYTLLTDAEKIPAFATRTLWLTDPKQEESLGEVLWQFDGKQQGEDYEQVQYHLDVSRTGQDGKKGVLRLIKRFRVVRGNDEMQMILIVENRTGSSARIQVAQDGPAGIVKEGVRSDARQVVLQLAQNHQLTPKAAAQALSGLVGNDEETESVLWSAQAADQGRALWWALTNKYFAMIMRIASDAQPITSWADLSVVKTRMSADHKDADHLRLQLTSRTLDIPPGKSWRIDTRVYCGAKGRKSFHARQLYLDLGYDRTIQFAWCTFSFLAVGMLWLLDKCYLLVGNYGLAIMGMVATVRILMHPITRKSQLSMQKMSKLAPEVEKLKQRFKDNKEALNREMMELYRKQGVSPISGCLPMVIQMPIWFALYGAINAAVELRHAPFFLWIKDLSGPDCLLRFTPFEIPLLGNIMGPVSSLNLLPLLLGLSFYLQQKMTPTATTGEQAKQQKTMMTFMMVFFTIMLYNAPAGLNLYIMASTFLGVLETKLIRRQIARKEQKEKEKR